MPAPARSHHRDSARHHPFPCRPHRWTVRGVSGEAGRQCGAAHLRRSGYRRGHGPGGRAGRLGAGRGGRCGVGLPERRRRPPGDRPVPTIDRHPVRPEQQQPAPAGAGGWSLSAADGRRRSRAAARTLGRVGSGRPTRRRAQGRSSRIVLSGPGAARRGRPTGGAGERRRGQLLRAPEPARVASPRGQRRPGAAHRPRRRHRRRIHFGRPRRRH